MSSPMKIAVIGLGGIGSTFAFQLSQYGHEVTVIARGKRLEQLQLAQAVECVDGKRAAVQVSAALDSTVEWDLVLVTVLASQVDELLPALAASAAKTVMFMFNTFELFGRLRDAVGSARFAFGFPAILARIEEGKLVSQIITVGQITLVTNEPWAKVFSQAGILTYVHTDMESWLRTHAAMVVPCITVAVLAHERHAGVSWTEAVQAARAMHEGFGVVRQLGNSVTPAAMNVLSHLPIRVMAAILWTVSKFAAVQRLGGVTGPKEARSLIDAMSAIAPEQTSALRAIRP